MPGKLKEERHLPRRHQKLNVRPLQSYSSRQKPKLNQAQCPRRQDASRQATLIPGCIKRLFADIGKRATVSKDQHAPGHMAKQRLGHRITRSRPMPKANGKQLRPAERFNFAVGQRLDGFAADLPQWAAERRQVRQATARLRDQPGGHRCEAGIVLLHSSRWQSICSLQMKPLRKMTLRA
jgi:hypothetical protein